MYQKQKKDMIMPVQTITAQEAREIMMDYPSAIILDVRRPEEYAAVRIPDAINIPLARLAYDMPRLIPRQDVRLLVYCRSGMRSYTAANELVAMGYTHVYDFGGILTWPYEKTM
jgi:rhodanese-related sulfurtransferase